MATKCRSYPRPAQWPCFDVARRAGELSARERACEPWAAAGGRWSSLQGYHQGCPGLLLASRKLGRPDRQCRASSRVRLTIRGPLRAAEPLGAPAAARGNASSRVRLTNGRKGDNKLVRLPFAAQPLANSATGQQAGPVLPNQGFTASHFIPRRTPLFGTFDESFLARPAAGRAVYGSPRDGRHLGEQFRLLPW